MRTSKFTGVLIGFAMLLTANAFAANKGSMQVQSPVMVGETQLPAGEYTVQWEETGPDLELTIKRDRKVKATVPAKLVPENSAFDQNATTIHVESDGSRKLFAIRLSGKRFTLQIEPQTDVVGTGRNDPEAWQNGPPRDQSQRNESHKRGAREVLADASTAALSLRCFPTLSQDYREK